MAVVSPSDSNPRLRGQDYGSFKQAWVPAHLRQGWTEVRSVAFVPPRYCFTHPQGTKPYPRTGFHPSGSSHCVPGRPYAAGPRAGWLACWRVPIERRMAVVRSRRSALPMSRRGRRPSLGRRKARRLGAGRRGLERPRARPEVGEGARQAAGAGRWRAGGSRGDARSRRSRVVVSPPGPTRMCPPGQGGVASWRRRSRSKVEAPV